MNLKSAVMAVMSGTCIFSLACSDSNNSNPGQQGEADAVLDFEAYSWEETSPGGYWDPRAGRQTVELNGRFFLLGGAHPIHPECRFQYPATAQYGLMSG